MARFLAIDWDHQYLHIVAATLRRGGGVQVQKAVVFEEPQNPYTAGPTVLGARLRDRLKEAHIAAAPVLACIGRDRIIVKDVRFPTAAPEEEPAIVRFQVVKELNEPADEVVIDYFAAPDQPGGGERRAFAVVARRNVVSTYQETCKVAGLKLAGIVPRPFGLLTTLRGQVGKSVVTPPPDPPDAAVAVLSVGKPWAEFCVARGDAMLFARSLTCGPALAGEIRRNLAVYAGQSPQHPVRAVYVAGSDDYVAVRERVQEPMGIPVYPLDPFGGEERSDIQPELRGAFAGIMGLLLARSQANEFPVNFIKPREPRPVRSPNRLLAILGVAAALVLVIAGAAFCYARLSERDAELTNLTADVSRMDQELASFRDDGVRLKALDSWNQSNVNWLDEIYDLTYEVPDLDKVRVAQFIGSRLPTIKEGKDKPVAKIELKVNTNDRFAVDRLNQTVSSEPHYKTSGALTSSKSTGSRVGRFPQQFNLRFELEKQSPDKYTRELPDSAPPNRPRRPERRGAPGDAIGGRTAP